PRPRRWRGCTARLTPSRMAPATGLAEGTRPPNDPIPAMVPDVWPHDLVGDRLPAATVRLALGAVLPALVGRPPAARPARVPPLPAASGRGAGARPGRRGAVIPLLHAAPASPCSPAALRP